MIVSVNNKIIITINLVIVILMTKVCGIFHSNRIIAVQTTNQLYKRSIENKANVTTTNAAQAILAAKSLVTTKLTFVQTMLAGAASRTIAQTVMHPANTYKTMLQLKGKGHLINITPERLLRGADAQFVMSLPHGAFYFFVIDYVKKSLLNKIPEKIEFLGDFACSTISTVVCSIVSTPQMVITDRLMAGVYPSFKTAVIEIFHHDGMKGFYRGWWPALAQKIPSYGLTWMFFQQMKRVYEDICKEKPNAEWNFGLGAAAAAAAVCVMIPIDVIKTRLVTQNCLSPQAYKGMIDCATRVLREEGIIAFYRSLPPRLVAVVPMIAIQFGVYDVLQKYFEKCNFEERTSRLQLRRKLPAHTQLVPSIPFK